MKTIKPTDMSLSDYKDELAIARKTIRSLNAKVRYRDELIQRLEKEAKTFTKHNEVLRHNVEYHIHENNRLSADRHSLHNWLMVMSSLAALFSILALVIGISSL